MTTELMVAARVLSKPINDLYELGKSKFKQELERAKAESNINNIYKSISSTHKVKTIWQIDKAVSLKSFYYPSSLIIDGIKTNINSIKKISGEENIIIQGMVGQGKSIFLRYLTYQETKIGEKIPIFFELRKIEKQETLKENIIKILDSYGFSPSDEIFDFLCESGKIVLILDGFDEVVSEKVSITIKEIEHLSEKHKNLRIIISSRPDSGIEKSPHFRVYKLAPLDEADIPLLLEKITSNKDQATEIYQAVKNSSTNIRSLLKTPLMATLLVLLYKSEQKIPEQLSEFYENLFSLLFYRHDKSKPGYTRERFTTLNERKLQQTFEAFCFITRRRGITTISNSDMHDSAEEAFNLTKVTCESPDFIKDITKISNLVIEEGQKYHFIHKSVQEFHAANYIKSRPEEASIKFYSSMIERRHIEWRQEIKFLSQIDTYRYLKYLLIPSASNFFNTLEISMEAWNDITERQAEKILKTLTFIIPQNEDEGLSYGLGNMGSTYSITDEVLLRILDDILEINGNGLGAVTQTKLLGEIKSLDEYQEQIMKSKEGEADEADEADEIEVTFFAYYKKHNLIKECQEIIDRTIKKYHQDITEHILFTNHEEQSLDI